MTTINMTIFSFLMLAAAASLIKKKQVQTEKPRPRNAKGRFILCCGIIGSVTGLLGAGGGFLLIPALVLFLNFEIREAVGTSLLIIAINSLFGFAIDLSHFSINWKLLGLILVFALVGIAIGQQIGRKVSPMQLKNLFGWFLLVMGTTIFLKESYLIVSTLKESYKHIGIQTRSTNSP